MKNLFISTLVCLGGIFSQLYAQLHSSAAFQIESTTKGFLPPLLTQQKINNIQNPADGLVVFCTDCTSKGSFVYNQTTWNHSGSPIRSTGDFVHGGDQLDNKAGITDDSRFFFDKSKSAFRTGEVTGTEWDETNLGDHSFATGEGKYCKCLWRNRFRHLCYQGHRDCQQF